MSCKNPSTKAFQYIWNELNVLKSQYFQGQPKMSLCSWQQHLGAVFMLQNWTHKMTLHMDEIFDNTVQLRLELI